MLLPMNPAQPVTMKHDAIYCFSRAKQLRLLGANNTGCLVQIDRF
jgi:hypothetical protein